MKAEIAAKLIVDAFLTRDVEGYFLIDCMRMMREELFSRKGWLIECDRSISNRNWKFKGSRRLSPLIGRLWFVLKLDKEHVLVQSLQEVTVIVLIPHGTKARFVACDIKKNHMKVRLKGQHPILEGNFYKPVKVDDCLWSIDTFALELDQGNLLLRVRLTISLEARLPVKFELLLTLDSPLEQRIRRHGKVKEMCSHY
ncbi:protein BOBBER 1 [Tanacetum coccineum]